MNDPSLDPLERQLANTPWPAAPPELRRAVLSGVHRQLAAQRWDRRLARAAVVLLGAGIALNGWVALRGPQYPGGSAVASSDAIVHVAVVVAEATDLETGNQFARHLAAFSGTTLTAEQTAAIQQQVKPRPAVGPRKEG